MKNVDCGAAIECVCFGKKKKIKTLFAFVEESFLISSTTQLSSGLYFIHEIRL